MAKKTGTTVQRIVKTVRMASSMEDEYILSLEKKGVKMIFDGEDFRILPDEIVKELSFENQRNYFVAQGVSKQIAKSKARKDAGFGDIQIIDPLKGKPVSKLEVRNQQKGMHYCWKRPDEIEGCKQLGYEMAEAEAKTKGASRASSSHVIVDKQGKDDLVLMKIPERVFQQHLQANALESRRRSGATFREISDLVRKSNKHLEDVELPAGFQDNTTTTEVPISAEMDK